ncbi:hypothetical protein B0H10DRAFT_1960658 [Mycena sp. CBHHK59/15]|nr:hypothetical protein B0H10DRAFT_1960658 [Mycena sp. CBHHK59/15]
MPMSTRMSWSSKAPTRDDGTEGLSLDDICFGFPVRHLVPPESGQGRLSRCPVPPAVSGSARFLDSLRWPEASALASADAYWQPEGAFPPIRCAIQESFLERTDPAAGSAPPVKGDGLTGRPDGAGPGPRIIGVKAWSPDAQIR